MTDPFVYTGPYRCPKCGNTLYVVDGEIAFVEMDEHGDPINERVNIRCEGICTVCGAIYDMRREGLRYRIASPEKEELEQYLSHQSRIQKMEEARLPANNPFGIPPDMVYHE